MASPFTNKQAIEAPPASPPRYGLLFAAAELAREARLFSAPLGAGMADGFPAQQLDSDGRWLGGVQWAPEQTLGGGVVGIDCRGNTDTMTPAATNPDITKADPFVVWAEDHCSTLGWKGRDFEGRARRQLEATQSFRIAHELWLGTEAQADSLDNDWLTKDPKILTGAGVAPHEALALTDMGLAQMLGGRRGMIHVSPQLLDELAQNYAIVLNGQLWMSPMGSIVVADAGYPGTKPDASGSTNQWIYGTSLVQYLLGPIEVVPSSFADAQKMARAIDLTINSVVVYAERPVILQWDSGIPIGSSGKVGVVAAETSTAAFAAL